MGRDSIIPIHNILGKFVKCNFNIGKRKLIEHMAIIPLNKRFRFKNKLTLFIPFVKIICSYTSIYKLKLLIIIIVYNFKIMIVFAAD